MGRKGRKGWTWSKKKLEIAGLIADGRLTIEDIAKKYGLSSRTIYRWQNQPEFNEKVGQLVLSTDIALKSERIRIARRIVREKLREGSQKDLLDWLKYIHEEIKEMKEEAQEAPSQEGSSPILSQLTQIILDEVDEGARQRIIKRLEEVGGCSMDMPSYWS